MIKQVKGRTFNRPQLEAIKAELELIKGTIKHQSIVGVSRNLQTSKLIQ